MAALNPRQRAYVLALVELPDGPGILRTAALRAGYGTPQSSSKSINQIASSLWHNEKIQRAYSEVGRKHLGKLGIRALKAAEKILDDPTHKDFFKCAKMALQYSWPLETLQTIEVHHSRVDPAEGAELCRRFAQEFDIPLERLLGAGRPKLIEAAATKVIEPVRRFMEGGNAIAEIKPKKQDARK
jgi:hypothetical protein